VLSTAEDGHQSKTMCQGTRKFQRGKKHAIKVGSGGTPYHLDGLVRKKTIFEGRGEASLALKSSESGLMRVDKKLERK